MITENEIIGLGFSKTGVESTLYVEYTLGEVKIQVYDKVALKIFIKGVKINQVDTVEELTGICNRVNKPS